MSNPRFPLSRLRPGRRFQLSHLTIRHQSTSCPRPQATTRSSPTHDPYALLSTPTWSIRSLLPPSTSTASQTPSPLSSLQQPQEEEDEISAHQLSHLLRLSALPPPTSPSHASQMLRTLHSQLHFVRDIQRVDTSNVAPLSSIHDETPEGLREATIGVETLKEALGREEVYGRCRRPRRRRCGDVRGLQVKGVEDWDVLGQAGEKVGRYFIVRSKGNGKVDGDVVGDGAKEGV
ncbi:hypothetical protein VTI74DRAFT_9453 [Chaetomium olivicolor]